MQPPFDIAADLDTPVSAYMKLAAFRPRFLLESVERGERLARYSFLGFGDALEVRLDAGGLRVGDRRLPRPADGPALLGALRDLLARTPRLAPAIDGVPLLGGLIGVASYDIVRYFERVPPSSKRNDDVPELAYVAPSSMLVFDHLTRRVALLHAGSETERRALRAEVIRALHGPLADAAPATFERPTHSLTDDQFMQAVATAKDYIRAGDVYQLVLSMNFRGACTLPPFQVYRAMRLLNPSPYMYFCELDDVTVAGSSPEALVRLHGSRASLRPIAGTRPRGDTPEADRAYEQELAADPKENAEHVMLVDLARNDLGRVARPGTIEVKPYRSVERYSHVMHLVSGVNGELEANADAFDLFAATFPAGTLVGAPKVRAMELIAELEPVPRGIYAGTVGYFGHGGDMDQAIAIRTIVFDNDSYSYQAGAGIVADSVPAAELAEVKAKSAILARALAIAEEGL